ncbi:MAG: 50S ribosomal protein L3 N(5)-glutamine methyltransferase [Arsenophonus sp.]|nr:MAG: 50S ribosomal protein L3 N(5)-glutamine methyltransferase [Arsenophonus sp.]
MIKKTLSQNVELLRIKDVLRWTITQFNRSKIFYGHGTDNAWDEALQLILSLLFLPLNIPEYMLNAYLTLNERKLIFKKIKKRIKNRIPVPYLINKSWFCNHEFYVDRRVHIPRSSISILIDNKFQGILKNEPKKILDLCTGSGCIAISCAYTFFQSNIDASDISLDALKVVKKNLKKHNLLNSIRMIHSNLFSNIKNYKYDLIISNPPYVSKKKMKLLPLEYHAEPKLSLIGGGKDGLNIIIKILKSSCFFLEDNGILICETGYNKEKIMKMYSKIPLIWFEIENKESNIFMITKEELIKNQKYFF